MPVFQDKFFLWGISVFFGSLAAHSAVKVADEISLGLVILFSFLLLILALSSKTPLKSISFACGFLLLAGFCRTINWNIRTPNISSELNHFEDFRESNNFVGLGQIQGLKWGGTEIFCIQGSPGLVGKSIVLYDLKLPDNGWIKFKLRSAHPLSKRGLLAFYATSASVVPSGFFVWLLDKRLNLRNHLLLNLEKSTQFYESLRSFWSSAILRHNSKKNHELKSSLKSLGLGAIFAVSGLHINLLALLAVGVLSIIPLSVRQSWLIFLTLVFTYAIIVGFTASVFRALCFTFLIRTANDSGLSIRSIRLLSAVFIIHILCFPEEVTEAGFLLSYGLTFLLIFIGSSFELKNLKHLLVQGFGIQVILIPYFLWQFGEYPLMHLACVFLAPIFSIILAVGFFTIFISLFSISFGATLSNSIAWPMNWFISLCSEWGQSSQILLLPSESFDGRFVLLFYSSVLLLMMRKRQIKVNPLSSSIGAWEVFLRKNQDKAYELHSLVYTKLFKEAYEPILALKTLQEYGLLRTWGYTAFVHLQQAWIKHAFENTIDPLRAVVNKHYSSSTNSLEPLFIHFIENKLHIQWTKNNLLSLSDWLLHLKISEEFSEILDLYRTDLQNLVDCSFLDSVEMRTLKSTKMQVFNQLPLFFKKFLVQRLILRLSRNHT